VILWLPLITNATTVDDQDTRNAVSVENFYANGVIIMMVCVKIAEKEK